MNKFISLILAAGEGKRMKSDKSKVVHLACGKPLIRWVCDSVTEAGIEEQIIVIGHRAEQVKEVMGQSCKYAIQSEQLGTGHAVLMAQEYLKNRGGSVLLLCGDTPLVTNQTLKKTIEYHETSGNSATVITAIIPEPKGYGRIVRDASGNVIKIVECKDANPQEKKICEINSGMYCFKIADLLEALKELKADNNQKEYYLTDTLEILIDKGCKVGASIIENKEEILGINDRVQLAEAAGILRARIIEKHMREGVTIIDPGSTYIDSEVSIGMDTIIYPMTILEGKTKIAQNCIIGPSTRLVNCEVEEASEVANSNGYDSSIGKNTHVGPFAYLRPGSIIGDNVKIGDFVEVKKSKIGDNTKISHLTYVGDAEIGKNVNLGCGVVVVNYDGINKNKTVVCDDAFVGCNVNLVSPVTVEKGSYVAAGSTITENVPQESLAIARCRQTVKENWAKNRIKTKK